jgi:hypothetical protein
VADQVLVADCSSTDETLAIAQAHGARVVQRAWVNYATQFNWALTQLDGDTDWVLRLDADEYLTPELAAEIRARLPGLGPEIDGVYCGRRMTFQGRLIRFGGGSHPGAAAGPLWAGAALQVGLRSETQRCPVRNLPMLGFQPSLRLWYPGTYPHLGGGDQGEGPTQGVTVGAQQVQDGRRLALAGEAGEAIQDDAGVDQALAEHQLPEILVGGQQKGTAAVGKVQNLVVVDSGVELLDIDGAVTRRPQGRDDRRVHILVGDQVQPLFPQAASAAIG